MKQFTLLYALSIFVLIVGATYPVSTFADGSCMQLNNGGITTQQFCPTPTPQPSNMPFPTLASSQQTQGGQKVYPPSKSKSTPDTGPTDWALPSLIFLGCLGFLLIKKTKTA